MRDIQEIPTQPTCAIQISIYLVQVSNMFQQYMVIIRLANRKYTKYTVPFRAEITLLYIPKKVKCSHYRPGCGPEGGYRYSSTLP